MHISCIIPTKDRCDMLITAIESVYEQELAVHEIIVVDDGSTDSTKQVIQTRFPEIKYIQTSGKGPGGARNLGVTHAQGDLLMFLDSDDRWLPNHTSSLASLIQQGHRVSYGVTMNINEFTGETFYIPEPPATLSTGSTFRDLLRWCFLVPSSIAITRNTFWASNGFPEHHFGEDWCFFLKLAEITDSFGFAQEIITHRRLHRGSLSHTGGQGARILTLLNEIMTIASQTNKALPEDLAYLKQAISLANEEYSKWNTVQDWFYAMKQLQNR